MKRTRAVILFLMVFLLTLSACGQKTPTWQEQYDLGVRYLEAGSYEEAIIAFTAAIEIDPKQPDAYLKAAEAYVALDDVDSAIAILEQGYEATGDSALQSYLNDLRDRFKNDRYSDFSSLDTEVQNLIYSILNKAVEEDATGIYGLLTDDYLQMVAHGAIADKIRTSIDGYKIQLHRATDSATSEYIGEVEIRPENGTAYLYSAMIVNGQLISTQIVGDCNSWNWNGYFEKDSNYYRIENVYSHIHVFGNCRNALLHGTITTTYMNGYEDMISEYENGKEIGRDDLADNLVITIDRGASLDYYEENWIW